VLRLTQLYRVHDATAYMLEKTGDISGALQLLVDDVRTRVSRLLELESDQPAEVSRDLMASVGLCVELCRRNADRVEDEENQQM
jgi:vacuolar protein sorting-associated protein 8